MNPVRSQENQLIRHSATVILLLKTHGRRLHALLHRLTRHPEVADDLLQDLAIRLADSDAFCDANSPHAFARRAALNLANDWHRRQKLRNTAPLLLDPPLEPAADALEQADEVDAVLRRLHTLDERSQEIIAMRYLDACSFEEIAIHLDCSPHVARAMTHKALTSLRNAIQANANSPREVRP